MLCESQPTRVPPSMAPIIVSMLPSVGSYKPKLATTWVTVTALAENSNWFCSNVG
jgi:hypothetical protein